MSDVEVTSLVCVCIHPCLEPECFHCTLNQGNELCLFIICEQLISYCIFMCLILVKVFALPEAILL